MTNKQHVVITGASRRLGLFLCGRFLASGYSVLAVTRSPSDELVQLAENADLAIFSVDSYEARNIETLIAQIKDARSKVHALIHNVSAFAKDGAQYSEQDFALFLRLHMALPAQLNMGLAPLLHDEQSPGNIIHITDIFADNPSATHVLYCASKAGLENLSKGFAKKLAPGVRVNTIQPGPIQFLPSHSEEDKRKVLAQTLLQREGGFMPIFQAICGILENSYMTGASIKVDGGRALGRG